MLKGFFQVFTFFYGIKLAPAIDGGMPHIVALVTGGAPAVGAIGVIGKIAVVTIGNQRGGLGNWVVGLFDMAGTNQFVVFLGQCIGTEANRESD